MKIGMNLLLWCDMVTEQHDGLLEEIKGIGFDAVEVPVFDTSRPRPLRAAGQAAEGAGPGGDGASR